MRAMLPKTYKSALLILAAGIALRLVELVVCHDTPLFGDASTYHRFALMYLDGRTFPTVRAPGLPLWLALWYSVFGSGQWSAMLAQMPFYLALSVAVYLYTARKLNARAALIALALVTFYPALVFHSIWPLTEVPLAALIMLVVWMMDDDPGLPGIFCAGILLGLAILIRPNSITLIPAFALLYYLGGARRRVLRTVLFAVVAMIPAAMWSAREYRHSGNMVFINYTNSMNFYLGNNEYTPLYRTWWLGSHGDGARGVPPQFTAERKEMESVPLERRNEAYLRAGLAEITAHPARFVLRTMNRICAFFSFDSYTATVAISDFDSGKPMGALLLGGDMLFYLTIVVASLFVVFGDWAQFGLRSRSLLVWVGVLVSAYALPFFLAFAHPTYHLPVMPLLAVPAAAALERFSFESGALRHSLHGITTNYKLTAALALLVLVQLEWILFMLPSFIHIRSI